MSTWGATVALCGYGAEVRGPCCGGFGAGCDADLLTRDWSAITSDVARAGGHQPADHLQRISGSSSSQDTRCAWPTD